MRIIRGWCRIALAILLIAFWTIFTAVGEFKRRSSAELARYRAKRQQGGCRLFCKVTGFHVTVDGERPPEGPMLYVSNHITAIDPILAGTQLEVAFAGKIEITGWPILGWIARSHGIIGVERSRRSRTRGLVEAIRSRLNHGVPVMVFPEGGIDWGETLLPFKTGTFEAVVGEESARIQPVFVDVVALDGKPKKGSEGRYAVSHRHHEVLFVHLAHILGYRSIGVEVRFGSPIPVGSLTRKGLADKARDAVLALRDQKQ